MRFSFASSLLLLAAGAANAASFWAFDEGSIAVLAKKGGEGIKEK
jgi:oligosaccharyltransferase complex subunit delta (ribophorin II)